MNRGFWTKTFVEVSFMQRKKVSPLIHFHALHICSWFQLRRSALFPAKMFFDGNYFPLLLTYEFVKLSLILRKKWSSEHIVASLEKRDENTLSRRQAKNFHPFPKKDSAFASSPISFPPLSIDAKYRVKSFDRQKPHSVKFGSDGENKERWNSLFSILDRVGHCRKSILDIKIFDFHPWSCKNCYSTLYVPILTV